MRINERERRALIRIFGDIGSDTKLVEAYEYLADAIDGNDDPDPVLKASYQTEWKNLRGLYGRLVESNPFNSLC